MSTPNAKSHRKHKFFSCTGKLKVCLGSLWLYSEHPITPQLSIHRLLSHGRYIQRPCYFSISHATEVYSLQSGKPCACKKIAFYYSNSEEFLYIIMFLPYLICIRSSGQGPTYCQKTVLCTIFYIEQAIHSKQILISKVGCTGASYNAHH